MRVWFGLFCLCAVALFADEPRLVIDSGGHQSVIRFVTFTHDRRYLVSAGDDKVIRIWDVGTGRTIRTIRGNIGDANEGKILAAALSPDDRYLAVGGWLAGSPDVGIIRIHDFQTGDVVGPPLRGDTNVVRSLAFSPNGRYLVSGSVDHSVRVWEMATRKLVHTLTGHQEEVYAVAFSPDGHRIVSGSDDKTLRLWDIESGNFLKEMKGHTNEVKSALFSPDGRYIVSGGRDRSIRLWDGQTGEFVKQLAAQYSEVWGLSFSPDGHRLLGGAVGDNICHVFEVPSGREMSSFSGHKNIVLATTFSPDGKMVATAGGNQDEIDIWNPSSGGLLRKLEGAGQFVWSVGFAKDGRSVAFGTTFQYSAKNNFGPLEKTLLLAETNDFGISLGQQVSSETKFVRARDQLGDISLIIKPGGKPDTDILQILKSGRLEHEITRDSTSGYRHDGYAISPNGAQIASGGGDGVLTLYSASSGQEVAPCVGHTSDVWAVAYSPDGKTLVSGSADQTIRLWDISPTSCRNLLTFFIGTDNEWVAWTPQGYYTASANGDKYIGWHVNQGIDQQAKFYPASTFQKQFYRPDIVSEFLNKRDINLAVRAANEKRGGDVRTEKVLGPEDIAKNPPPHIVIVSPHEERATTTEPLYHVVGEAVSDLAVTRFELLVNGVSVAGALRGSPNERQLEAEVQLHPGQNTLSFLASNSKADSPPKERVVTYTPRPGAGGVLEKPKLILLAIGISKYEHPTFKLDWADNDALEVEQTFLTQKGPLYSDVIRKHLVNGEATKDNILDGLRWLNEQGDDADIRLVFLSGHGGLDTYGNYYFYSVNHDPRRDPESRDVRWETLLERLTSSKRKAVLIVDSCHAAAVTGGPKPRGDVDFEQVLRQMNSEFRGLFTLAASMGTESSLESSDWQHGAFTKALLDALRNRNDQGKVLSTDDITAKVKDSVKSLTHDEQHPKSAYSETLTEFPIFWVSSGVGR